MPVNVPNNLPAIDVLKEENIFVMENSVAIHQDIRPLRIAILNIMPIKSTTETQLLRILSNSPLQLEIELFYLDEHESTHTPKEHLMVFYKTFKEIKNKRYDGMIVTGAPVERLEFEDVDYWEQMKEVMDWSTTHVTSTFFICWASQAALYHLYGVPKYMLPKKLSGVFSHNVLNTKIPIVRGFDDAFVAPHSRFTGIKSSDILKNQELEIVAESEEAGPYIIISKDGRQVFVPGHSEYDPLTLKEEYFRDINKGMKVDIPRNYFPDNDPTRDPIVQWRSHANLLFLNWLNYYVYQQTPYIIDE